MRTLGDRLRELRKRHGLSQRELAASSGVSVSLIRKLEQGEREDTRMETLRKLAAALDLPTTMLVQNAPAPADAEDTAWEPVRRALASPGGDAILESATEDGLARALSAAVKLYHDNRYQDLARVLPGLLRDAENASPPLRSRVNQLTGSLLVQTRQRAAARIALDRSVADAEASGSALDAASSVITLCWLLLLERQFDQVWSLATGWAGQIEPRLSAATTAEISTWGWLLLRASAAAIRDNRPSEAADTMRLAQAAAAATRPSQRPYHSYWTTFGPATVAMKQVENAVIDGKPDTALLLAASVPASLRPTSDNRNRHLLDVAAAHLALRHYPETFDVLFRLSKEAPAWLAHQRLAKDLLGAIVTQRRTLTPGMRELAATINLPV
ncbi:MAG: helix-turn-helix domain-containing protein [Nocardiopsaceae bacterium]|nr:helix-turn-helix domain-containing protein [Nocardiopsaceae bacterium]